VPDSRRIVTNRAGTTPESVTGLLELRRLILETAVETDGAGKIVETLKWGQPSYLTEKPKSGTTIRIAKDGSELGDIALYVSCSTSLVSEWRGLFPDLIIRRRPQPAPFPRQTPASAGVEADDRDGLDLPQQKEIALKHLH
jgi:hypothetical protein